MNKLKVVLIIVIFFLFCGYKENVNGYNNLLDEVESLILYVKSGASGDCLSWDTACELQPAIDLAGRGDEIWVAEGTYKPSEPSTPIERYSTFQMKSGVSLYGGFPSEGGNWESRDWENKTTILSGDIGVEGDNSDNCYHVVTANSIDTTAVLDGFTITVGNANSTTPYNSGGGLYSDNSSPSITNVIFYSNNSAGSGGGMSIWTGNPIFTNVTFESNSSENGGGLAITSGNPEFNNVTFYGNQAIREGGGICIQEESYPELYEVDFINNISVNGWGGGIYTSSSTNPHLLYVNFTGNQATSGGGIYISETTANMINVSFSNNWAKYNGGGMYNNYSNPILSNITFENNSAEYQGGGMYNMYSNPEVSHTNFYTNTANEGSGMYNRESSPILTDVSFENNSLHGMFNFKNSNPISKNVTFSNNTGTGMMNYRDCSPTLTDVRFINNTNTDVGNGGGINNHTRCNVTLTNVVFSGNVHSLNGGAIFNAASSNTILRNVTISGNTAEINGGGIYNGEDSNIDMENVTIVGNFAKEDSGGIYNSVGIVTITNSIIWNNSPNQIIGGFPTITYSDIQGDYAGVGNINIDPVLGYLANNGGYTQTHAIFAGSPVIDAGDPNNCLTTDQRDYTRPMDGDIDGEAICDMGAFEFDPTSPIYNLTVNVIGEGEVDVYPNQTQFYIGNEITLTPIAEPGWTFTGWSGDASGNENPLTVTIEGDTNITANFTQDEYTLSVGVTPASSGTVDISPDQATYHYGDQVTLTANAELGWTFTGWSGDVTSTDNPLVVTIEGDTNITADFIFQIFMPLVLN